MVKAAPPAATSVRNSRRVIPPFFSMWTPLARKSISPAATFREPYFDFFDNNLFKKN
jgi:hypothetical protein